MEQILDRFIQYCFSGTSNEGTHVDQLSHPNPDKKRKSIQLALHIKIRSSVFPESDKEEVILSEIKAYRENSERSLHIQLGKLRRELIKKLIDKYVAELFNKRKMPILSNDKFFSLHTLKKIDIIKSEILNMFRMTLEDVELFEKKVLRRRDTKLIAQFIMKAFEEYANLHKNDVDSKEFVLVSDSDITQVSDYFRSRYEYMINILNETKKITKNDVVDATETGDQLQVNKYDENPIVEEKKDNRIALPVGMNQRKKDIQEASLLKKIMNVGLIHAGVNHV